MTKIIVHQMIFKTILFNPKSC